MNQNSTATLQAFSSAAPHQLPHQLSPVPAGFENAGLGTPHLGAPILVNFPPAFGVGGLSELIQLSVKSIQTYRTRAPHKLPPACSPPDAKFPVWLLADVLAWLATYRESAVGVPPRSKKKEEEEKILPVPNSLCRRPTKVEEEAARLAGFVGEGAVTAHRAALRAAAQEGGVQP